MSKSLNSKIRRISVIYLIISSILASILLFVWGQPMWGAMVLAIFALVLVWEAYSLIKHGNTISNQYKLWLQKKTFKARLCIVILISSFVALGVHLWPK